MICAEITHFQRVPKRTLLSVRVFSPVVGQTKIRRREKKKCYPPRWSGYALKAY